MATPGELRGFNGATCDCGFVMELRVLQSAAGYYLGYFCDNCGPYSRETAYYGSFYAAENDLMLARAGIIPETARHTGYVPGPIEMYVMEEGDEYPGKLKHIFEPIDV